MNKIKKVIIFLALIALFVFTFNNANAYIFGIDSGLMGSAVESGHTTEVENNYDIRKMIGNGISITLLVLGIVFLGLIIYGGFIWMIARGDQSEVEKALEIIKNSVIGLVIVLAAYAITVFIGRAIMTTTITTDSGNIIVENLNE